MFQRIAKRIFGVTRLEGAFADAESRRTGGTIFARFTESLDLRLIVSERDVRRIPARGPLVVVANHPTGAAEGIALTARIETVREDRGLYQNGTLWVPIEEREDILRWRDPRGTQRESTLRLRSTRHGPLIEGLTPSEGTSEESAGGVSKNAARAMAWTGARLGDGLTSMLALLRLKNADGVMAALSEHHEPVVAVARPA